MYETEPWMAVALAAVYVGVRVREWWQDRRTPDGPVEEAHRAYREGEIGEAELERRLELAVDPEADRIRETVERVNGVGPATSAAVATRFDSVAELENADADDLEDVPNVGPDRAEAIAERLE